MRRRTRSCPRLVGRHGGWRGWSRRRMRWRGRQADFGPRHTPLIGARGDTRDATNHLLAIVLAIAPPAQPDAVLSRGALKHCVREVGRSDLRRGPPRVDPAVPTWPIAAANLPRRWDCRSRRWRRRVWRMWRWHRRWRRWWQRADAGRCLPAIKAIGAQAGSSDLRAASIRVAQAAACAAALAI